MSISIITPADFVREIESLMKEKSCTYMEAILDFADDNNIDYAKLRKLMPSYMKDLLKTEATRLNMLPKKSKSIF